VHRSKWDVAGKELNPRQQAGGGTLPRGRRRCEEVTGEMKPSYIKGALRHTYLRERYAMPKNKEGIIPCLQSKNDKIEGRRGGSNISRRHELKGFLGGRVACTPFPPTRASNESGPAAKAKKSGNWDEAVDNGKSIGAGEGGAVRNSRGESGQTTVRRIPRKVSSKRKLIF